MAKKKTETIEEILVPATLEDVMSERFGRYSKYIIQERALPDARDGLKPVQRRILYAMYHDGNTFDHPYRKSAKTVGLVIGNYHPHGDTSVYDAMVRMSQDWKVRLPLIDMHGNNGSIDDDPAAAMRYTEARLSKVASTMEEDLDKETVEFAPNFDDTENEPTVLPAPFPVLLVNGAAGIAAGYATNIPPNNLGETVDAAIYRIQNPSCSLEEIMEIMPGPDFPTGGIVQGRKGLEDAFRTGKGKIVVRSKTEIVETKTCNQIVITEIPYEVVKSDIVKKMDDIRLSKDIEGIMDVRDESDRNGLRIVADIKKEVPAQTVLNYFFKNTDLQINYNYNMVAIVNKRPELLGVLEMLDAFIAHREEVVLRRSKYNLNKMEERCQVLEGLMKAISVLDEVIAIIRKSKDKKDSKERLKDAFGFSEIQAEAIVTLRLYRLSNTDIKALREEFALLVNKIEETKTIIQYPNVLRAKIVSELKEIKAEYADERRTKIEDEVQEIVIDKLSMIPNERV
ncbi:MAG: DNA topoisomerase 4 subunit A, partial [Erysipelotrichaceae bacterium]|nr:DNA topoisomerase 4 subunit A [Erysipelotrichaceae bacterium]